MPMHDWTRVDAGLYHDFHQGWSVAITNAMNGGLLSPDYYALIELPDGGKILEPWHEGDDSWEADVYAGRANRTTVRHRHGEVVAVIELISPGNKRSKGEFDLLIRKSADLLKAGVNQLIVDPFPPGRRDPHGVHSAVWGEFGEEPYDPPAGRPLAASGYDAGECVAYVEPFAVGEPVPDVPLFLRAGTYVTRPLEASYLETWRVFPAALKGLLG